MNNNNMNNTDKPNVILHGEAMIFEVAEIPATAAPLAVDKVFIVANSETTGNHHVIDVRPGIEFFQDGGRKFVRVGPAAEARVRCVLPERHSPIAIVPGTYEFGTQQEYDPFTANMRAVQD